MWPFSYSRCAVDIVYFAEKPSLRDASCWSVVVRNGAYGERRYGLRSTDLTLNGTPVRRLASSPASSRWTTPGGIWPAWASAVPAVPAGAGTGGVVPAAPLPARVTAVPDR